MKIGDELRPRRLQLGDEVAFLVGDPFAMAAGFVIVKVDQDAVLRRARSHDEQVVSRIRGKRLFIARLHGRADGFVRQAALDDRRVRLLPAMQLVKEDCQRSGQADDVDQGCKGDAEGGMTGQHGADELRWKKLALARLLRGHVLHYENAFGRNAMPYPSAETASKMTVARMRRGSQSVQAMPAPQRMGTRRPPITARSGGGNGK